MIIKLPLPPTTNATYMVGNGRMYKSKKATDWMNDAIFEIKKDCNHDRFTEDISVFIQFNIKRDRDVDGAVKPILDVLQHTKIVENDRQVKSLKVVINKQSKKEDVEVRIEPI